jgi:hypothetical protein
MNDFRCSDCPISFNCLQGLQNTLAVLECRFFEYFLEEFVRFSLPLLKEV